MNKDEWARCRPWVESALKYSQGLFSIEDIEAGVEANTYGFLPGEKCACVFQITQYPRKKVLNIFLAGGNRAEIEEKMLPYLEENACLLFGCQMVTASVRRGLEKSADQHGYRHAWSVLAKDVVQ